MTVRAVYDKACARRVNVCQRELIGLGREPAQGRAGQGEARRNGSRRARMS